MEVRIAQSRHAVVTEAYDSARGKFVPAAEFSDEAPLIVFCAPTKKRGIWSYTSDVKAGGVYDECGYMVAQEWCDFEDLEALAKRLGMGHYGTRCYVYNGGRQPILPCLHTHAGQQTELRFDNLIPRVVDMLNRKEGIEAELFCDTTIIVRTED